MLLCYLDESGSTGSRLDDLDQPIHHIVAVLVREDRLRSMNGALDLLASSAPTTSTLVEYHGNEIFGGTGAWKGVPPRTRVQEYTKALRVLADIDATIAHASINKPALATKGYTEPNPHLFALQFLTEKLEKWVRDQTNPHPLGQTLMLVADENHEQEQYAIQLVSRMTSLGGPVGRGTGLAVSLDHFVENVYFARSHQSRGLQLADLVAFVLNRYERNQRRRTNDESSKAVAELWQNYVAPHVRTYRTAWPSN